MGRGFKQGGGAGLDRAAIARIEHGIDGTVVAEHVADGRGMAGNRIGLGQHHSLGVDREVDPASRIHQQAALGIAGQAIGVAQLSNGGGAVTGLELQGAFKGIANAIAHHAGAGMGHQVHTRGNRQITTG